MMPKDTRIMTQGDANAREKESLWNHEYLQQVTCEYRQWLSR